MKVVQVYGAFYIAPSTRGWDDEEAAKQALAAVPVVDVERATREYAERAKVKPT